MNKMLGAGLIALPLVIGGIGIVAANSQGNKNEPKTEAVAEGYTCPITGEELPCPNCCPLKN